MSSGDHTIVTQQRVDPRLAPAEGLERLDRGAAAADGENFVAETRARAFVEDPVLLEQAVGVRRQHLSPLVAVIAGSVRPGKDVREIVQEAVVLRRNDHGDLGADLLEQLLWGLRAFRSEAR